MKKVLFVLIVLLAFCFAGSSHAQCTFSPIQSYSYGNIGMVKKSLLVTCVAGVGGAIEQKSINVNLFQLKGFYLLAAETSPGATAPTNLYDLVLNNDLGVDLLTGQGADRSSTTKQVVNPTAFVPILGDLNQVITNNSEVGAVIYIRYSFVME